MGFHVCESWETGHSWMSFRKKQAAGGIVSEDFAFNGDVTATGLAQGFERLPGSEQLQLVSAGATEVGGGELEFFFADTGFAGGDLEHLGDLFCQTAGAAHALAEI